MSACDVPQVGDMQEKCEATKARLEQQQGLLLQRKDMLRQIVEEKAFKYQAKKAQLKENNVQVGEGVQGHLGLLQDSLQDSDEKEFKFLRPRKVASSMLVWLLHKTRTYVSSYFYSDVTHCDTLLHSQSTLEKMESKLRNVHANIFQISDAIKTKESETNYKKLALDIHQLTEELNNSVMRTLVTA